MGISTRPAREDDYVVFARLQPQLGTPDPVPSRARWQNEICAQTLLAERDGVVVGYVFGQALRDTGYVRNVVTDAPARGQGVGAALMRAIAARFRASGCGRWCLNVKPDNVPALALYEGLGMSRAYRACMMQVPWSEIVRLPSPPAGVVARAALASDDGALEAAFDLAAGQIAYARDHGWVVLCLDDAAGVACFNPAFPGAFPFRARALDGASALLAGMRPHALPEHDYVRVMVEDDDAMRDALRAIGAKVALETLHLRGEIPSV